MSSPASPTLVQKSNHAAAPVSNRRDGQVARRSAEISQVAKTSFGGLCASFARSKGVEVILSACVIGAGAFLLVSNPFGWAAATAAKVFFISVIVLGSLSLINCVIHSPGQPKAQALPAPANNANAAPIPVNYAAAQAANAANEADSACQTAVEAAAAVNPAESVLKALEVGKIIQRNARQHEVTVNKSNAASNCSPRALSPLAKLVQQEQSKARFEAAKAELKKKK